MRPVRFVALSEDGQALILTDEVGRMLSLAIDEQILTAVQRERTATPGQLAMDVEATLTPRDIQSRIRSGDTAEHIARLANVPMEKVLRFAGPVLQERAAMAQLARRTRVKGGQDGQTLADIADGRLRSHGVDVETVAWDAYRRDDGGWRITATWPSGKATAQAIWDLDRTRSTVSPADDMAQFLSAERQQLLLAQDGPTNEHRPANRFVDDADPTEGPAVPSLAVLRARSERGREEPRREARGWETPHRDEPSRDEPSREEAPREEPRRAESWRDRLDSAGLGAASAPAPKPAAASAAASVSTGPAQGGQRKNRAELPSWDDILFGSRRGPG